MIIPRREVISGLVVAALLAGGCVGGSLASSTGILQPGCKWSSTSKQMVHVGEEVAFDFVLVDEFGRFLPPLGMADYCVTMINGQRIETHPDQFGRFRFSYSFDDLRTGDKLKVETTAYLQRGARDFMEIAGEWVQTQSAYDVPDKRMASDNIVLTAYQAPIEIAIPASQDEFVPNTGVLRIRRKDGSSRSVYIAMPARPGFTLTGPDGDGFCHVHYLPSGSDLDGTGRTEVRFIIYDVQGQPHEVSTRIETP